MTKCKKLKELIENFSPHESITDNTGGILIEIKLSKRKKKKYMKRYKHPPYCIVQGEFSYVRSDHYGRCKTQIHVEYYY